MILFIYLYKIPELRSMSVERQYPQFTKSHSPVSKVKLIFEIHKLAIGFENGLLKVYNLHLFTFQEFFEANNKDRDMITEFICYDVYCQWSGDYHKYYLNDNFNIHVKNLADHEIENFEEWLESLTRDKPLTVSIKSAAFALMSKQQLAKWHHYLLSIGLK